MRCIGLSAPGIYKDWKTKEIWLLGEVGESGKLEEQEIRGD